MGTLNTGSWAVEFDDRLLTHLQIVIVNRLRRGEPLVLSWLNSTTVGGGRGSLWLSHTAPIYFAFNGSRVPAVDPAWLQRLEESAASSSGLVVVDVDGTPIRAGAPVPLHGRRR